VEESKNIDRLFQEKLKDFEVYPPNKAWDSIENQLGAIPQKQRIIPIWFKVASAVAFLLLFFSISAIYLMPTTNFAEKLFAKTNQNQEIVKTDTLSNVNKGKERNSAKKINFPKTSIDLAEKETLSTLKHVSEKTAKNNLEKDNLTKKVADKYRLADAISLPLSTTNNKIPKKEIITDRFTVATIFAPIYSSSFGGGSGIDSQFKDNPTSGNTSYSYGVKFVYRLTNKFSLQSGVNLINLGFKTSNIYIAPNVAVVSFSDLSSMPSIARSENASEVKNAIDENKGSLNQVFGYIEIPVEIKYSITDGKFGINLVGGFSTLLLNRDEVFIETNSFTQSLGSSNSLRSVNFSGNIGVDIDYLIKKNLYINVSPMFKIQTNTFSKNSGSFQPYYIGIYTGLNYKF